MPHHEGNRLTRSAKNQMICVGCASGCADCPRGDVRRLARVRPHVDLREPRIDRDQAARRPAGRLPLRARAARGLGRRHGDGLGDRARRARARDPAHDAPASATRSARLRPRASTAHPSSSSSASRTGATSRPSRSSRASCTGSRASIRSGSTSPCEPRTCPGAIARAFHEAVTGSGPALVIVPMDDWARRREPADERAAPRRVVRASRRRRRTSVAELAGLVSPAHEPGARRRRGRRRSRDLAGARRARRAARAARSGRSPSARAPGFPQDHALFAGHLPADRTRLRETLAPHDVVLAIGAPVFRQYPFIAGPFVEAGHAWSRWSATTRPRCIGAAPTWRCSRRPGRSAPSSRARCRRAAGTPPPVARPPAPPAPPAAGEPLRAGARLRRDRRAHPAQRDRDRGVAVEPARAARAPAGPRAARLAEPRDGRARIRPARGDRPAHGAARTGRSSRSSATARRCTRSRRSGARRTTASARSS